MGIYNIFIVSKSGGLIYHYDHNLPQKETEKTFSYPLDIHLHLEQVTLFDIQITIVKVTSVDWQDFELHFSLITNVL